ncbi:MAG: thiamine phosphate synthase [Clostridium sp.]|nr:thiamine phosphate synthase [Clostridium sp.]
MRRIAITPPYFYPGEAESICRMLDREGYWRIHIRKPYATATETEELLRAIPKEYYPFLSLHDHFDLALKYRLGGIHLNRRNPAVPDDWDCLVSKSLHSLDEIRSFPLDEYDYATISPVFPSISKPGYCPKFTLDELRPLIRPWMFALGGITPERIPELAESGFEGVAMLSAAWRRVPDPEHFRLQFISDGDSRETQVAGIRDALAGGCRWIQLRMKGAPENAVREVGREVAEICRENGATLILDDHVGLVRELGADGVHLGRQDMPVADARRILGPGKIIGATANTEDDIVAAAGAGADYIGLGPLRFTTTKQNLSPVLGYEGYRRIISSVRRRGIGLPVVAIGGIVPEDIAPLMGAEASGIAVSGTILRATSPSEMTNKLITKLNQLYGKTDNRRT